MAYSLRILCGRTGRGLRNERSAACHLWIAATLVCAAFSRHTTSLFSSCQRPRHGRILDGRPLDSRCYALLSSFLAGDACRGVPRSNPQSSPAWRGFYEVRLRRPGMHRSHLIDPINQRAALRTHHATHCTRSVRRENVPFCNAVSKHSGATSRVARDPTGTRNQPSVFVSSFTLIGGQSPV